MNEQQEKALEEWFWQNRTRMLNCNGLLNLSVEQVKKLYEIPINDKRRMQK